MNNNHCAGSAKHMRRVVRSAVIVTMMTLSAATVLPASALAHDRRDGDEMCRQTVNQILDVADARIARFKAELRLTAEQDKNWDSTQKALHDMAQRRADRMLKLREQRAATMREAQRTDDKEGKAKADSGRGDRDWTAISDMRMQADLLNVRADDLRKIADASSALYDSLEPSQRRRFGAFVSHYIGDEGESVCHR
ncbi:Spy/CpxP family protein refolding chaperone [Methylocystis parvus]|nr:Spy/CpxP family protein refolding chaperone [Methylocystis parvus]WBJ98801.1 Spy/CpxP family protein refolding chaperone [Methylocystis parvus OBBP]